MTDLRCSFCGKHQDQVKKLVAGGAQPGTFICDECVALCQQIIEENLLTPTPPAPPAEGWMDRLRRIGAALPR